MFDLFFQLILPGASHSRFSYGLATLVAELPNLIVAKNHYFH